MIIQSLNFNPLEVLAMHPASAFFETDQERLRGLIGERGFGLIIAQGPNGPVCAHAPILLEQSVLRFHLSSANGLNAAFAHDSRALCVVTGPDAYVSPDWYGIRDQVPTWNYVSVEISGTVRAVSSEDAALMLDDLSAMFEKRLAPKPPWTRAKMDPTKFDTMVRQGIIAYEMDITSLTGVSKLSQNKPREAIEGVRSALSQSDDAQARALGMMMVQDPKPQS
jgi:transcriptional regulator